MPTSKKYKQRYNEIQNKKEKQNQREPMSGKGVQRFTDPVNEGIKGQKQIFHESISPSKNSEEARSKKTIEKNSPNRNTGYYLKLRNLIKVINYSLKKR